MPEEVTIGELNRNLTSFREQIHQEMNSSRSDNQVAVGKIEKQIGDMRTEIAQGYVPTVIWEEVRRVQGDRVRALEDKFASLNNKAWTAIVIPVGLMVLAYYMGGR